MCAISDRRFASELTVELPQFAWFAMTLPERQAGRCQPDQGNNQVPLRPLWVKNPHNELKHAERARQPDFHRIPVSDNGSHHGASIEVAMTRGGVDTFRSA
jgi:hypothetical protein